MPDLPNTDIYSSPLVFVHDPNVPGYERILIEDTDNAPAADDACAGSNVQSKLEMDAAGGAAFGAGAADDQAGSASLALAEEGSVKNEDLLKDEASVTLEVASNFAEIDSNSFGEASSDVFVIKNDVVVIAGEAKEKTKDAAGASKNPVVDRQQDFNKAWLTLNKVSFDDFVRHNTNFRKCSQDDREMIIRNCSNAIVGVTKNGDLLDRRLLKQQLTLMRPNEETRIQNVQSYVVIDKIVSLTDFRI